MAIVINKAAVRRSLEAWFNAARAGETLGARETSAMPSHEVAALSSDYFYDLLCADEDSVQANLGVLVAEEDIGVGQIVEIDYALCKVRGVSGAGASNEQQQLPLDSQTIGAVQGSGEPNAPTYLKVMTSKGNEAYGQVSESVAVSVQADPLPGFFG